MASSSLSPAYIFAGRIWTILMYSIGVLFVAFGTFQAVGEIRFERHAVSTHGRIVAEHQSYCGGEGQEGATCYSPVIAFTTAAGRLVQFDGRPSSTPAEIGEEMPILYNPIDTADARIDRIGERWWGVPFIAFGLIDLGGMLVYTARERRRKYC